MNIQKTRYKVVRTWEAQLYKNKANAFCLKNKKKLDR